MKRKIENFLEVYSENQEAKKTVFPKLGALPKSREKTQHINSLKNQKNKLMISLEKFKQISKSNFNLTGKMTDNPSSKHKNVLTYRKMKQNENRLFKISDIISSKQNLVPFFTVRIEEKKENTVKMASNERLQNICKKRSAMNINAKYIVSKMSMFKKSFLKKQTSEIFTENQISKNQILEKRQNNFNEFYKPRKLSRERPDNSHSNESFSIQEVENSKNKSIEKQLFDEQTSIFCRDEKSENDLSESRIPSVRDLSRLSLMIELCNRKRRFRPKRKNSTEKSERIKIQKTQSNDNSNKSSSPKKSFGQINQNMTKFAMNLRKISVCVKWFNADQNTTQIKKREKRNTDFNCQLNLTEEIPKINKKSIKNKMIVDTFSLNHQSFQEQKESKMVSEQTRTVKCPFAKKYDQNFINETCVFEYWKEKIYKSEWIDNIVFLLHSLSNLEEVHNYILFPEIESKKLDIFAEKIEKNCPKEKILIDILKRCYKDVINDHSSIIPVNN